MTSFPLEEQRRLVEEITRPLDALFPLARLHRDRDGDRARWTEITALGWLGIAIPEDQGGAGLGPIEETLMFMALGRHLLAPAAAATVIAAAMTAAAGKADLTTRLLDGRLIATFGLPRPSAAAEAGGSITTVAPHPGDLAVDFAPSELVLSEIGGPARCIDADHWSLPLVQGPPGAVIARSSAPRLRARADLIVAAQLAGIAATATAMAVGHATIREQFGRPIGAFQAIKHHCATMAMLDFGARHLVDYAAAGLATGREDAALDCLAALNFAARAAQRNAGASIQIHGGMGFSDECDAHLLLKRAVLFERIAGGLPAMRRRMAGRVPGS